MVRPQESNLQPPALQKRALPTELILVVQWNTGYIWGRATTTTTKIESDINRIRKKAWLKVFISPQRIILFKMVSRYTGWR